MDGLLPPPSAITPAQIPDGGGFTGVAAAVGQLVSGGAKISSIKLSLFKLSITKQLEMRKLATFVF
jgi:hypothetical protein